MATTTIIAEQEAYADAHSLAAVFELLTTAVLAARPDAPGAFIASEARKLAADAAYQPVVVSPRCVAADARLPSYAPRS